MPQHASTCRALTHVSTGAGVCAARSVLWAGPGARPARPARAQPPQGPRGDQVSSPVIIQTEMIASPPFSDEAKRVLRENLELEYELYDFVNARLNNQYNECQGKIRT